MKLANKLHYLMLLSGVSQIELANQTKIERSTLTKILNGSTTQPKTDTIYTLAKYFNVDISELLDNFNDNKLGSQPISTLPSTLKTLMSAQNLANANQLGRKIGLPTNVILDILNEKTTHPKIKTLQLLADFFGISIPQLCGMDKLPFNYQAAIFPTSVPILEFEQIPSWLSNNKNLVPHISYIDVPLSESHNMYYAIKIQNNQFFPDLFAGNILIFDNITLPRNKDLVMVSLDKTISIYELLDQSTDACLIRELGSKTSNKINHSNLEILGVVIQQIINRSN